MKLSSGQISEMYIYCRILYAFSFQLNLSLYSKYIRMPLLIVAFLKQSRLFQQLLQKKNERYLDYGNFIWERCVIV